MEGALSLLPPGGRRRLGYTGHEQNFDGASSWLLLQGTASYYTVKIGGEVIPDAAWYYPEAKAGKAKEIEGYVAFYKVRPLSCLLFREPDRVLGA